ncbi:ferric achromobactin inner membrane permease [Advenella kashmirensis WT001]|uniref:Ferric achromobactin inner membrane permease n=1 Tax=Advenella kashmirensis (strain DSM 17095 / LMG 22695 / WT001) TaxID=1036672 RepID=I3UFB8_ADVKW|nr:ferric achromobactin inner membrane permease [Advenella kashmirensis WT001]
MTTLHTRSGAVLTLAIGFGLLVLLSILSLSIGKTYIAPGDVLGALFKPDPLDINHILVNTTRLSRMTVAIAVGACLAVAGGLMQAVTRNPLASPGLFGINAGAVFSIVLLAPLFGSSSLTQFMMLAFAGAAVAAPWFIASACSAAAAPFALCWQAPPLPPCLHHSPRRCW